MEVELPFDVILPVDYAKSNFKAQENLWRQHLQSRQCGEVAGMERTRLEKLEVQQ